MNWQKARSRPARSLIGITCQSPLFLLQAFFLGGTLQADSIRTLAVVVAVFFFAGNLSGSFLTVYYHEELGLSILEIVMILLFTFPLIGLLPLILLRSVRNFEKILSYGIFLTMLFYVILVFVRNPIILGPAYGLSIATFWPSFNLLTFRVSESKMHARTISLLSSMIPSLTSIIGPAVGGLIIESYQFTVLFVVAVALYVIAFLLSLRIRYRPETCGFLIPRNKTFVVFFASFILLGLSEAYWLGYPLFVLSVSGTFFNMGIVLALSAAMISTATFLVNWLSDVKRARVSFAIIGASILAVWFFALSFVSSTYEIVVLSLLDDIAAAFSVSWFAHFGDCFSKEHYASILVLMETGLMIGRIGNLLPTYVFITSANFAGYFRFSGIALLLLTPLYVVSRRRWQVACPAKLYHLVCCKMTLNRC